MEIHLTARHCELDTRVRQFVRQRFEKLQRYDGEIREVRLIVSAERKLHTAEITLRAHQQDVVITESHVDPIAAIDHAVDRLEERIRRFKEKRVSAPRREGRGNGAVPVEPEVAGEEPAEDEA